MPSLYDIKRRSRNRIHGAFRVPAFYYPSGPSGGYTEVGVREHTQFTTTGTLPGDDMGYMTQRETDPHLIFDLNEIEPKRGAMVSLRPGVVYAVGTVDPADGQFQKAYVEAQRESAASQFEAPEDPYGE